MHQWHVPLLALVSERSRRRSRAAPSDRPVRRGWPVLPDTASRPLPDILPAPGRPPAAAGRRAGRPV